MVFIYKCRDCEMSHHISMTSEQAELLNKNPRKVYDVLPQLSGCYKEMIQHRTCPHCGGMVKPN